MIDIMIDILMIENKEIQIIINILYHFINILIARLIMLIFLNIDSNYKSQKNFYLRLVKFRI